MPSIKLTAEPQKYRKGKRSPRPPQDMPFDVAMRKFKKAVEAAGILQDVRRKEYYEKQHGNVNVKKLKRSLVIRENLLLNKRNSVGGEYDECNG